jgi:hypothetical protein
MRNRFSQIIIIIYFLIYVLSNSLFVTNNEDLQLDNSSPQYWLRHGFVLITAFLAIFYFKKEDLYFVFSILIISLIYLISEQYVLGIMTIILAMSSVLFGHGFKNICFENKKLILPLILISLIPFFLNFSQFFENGFFSSKYGRDRMLLGYFHPKEAAQPFLIITILLFITLSKHRKIIFFSGVLLLFFIGSRNSLLYLLIFGYLTSKFKLKSLLLFFVLISIIFYLLLNINNVTNIIDNFSSDRISAWTDLIKYQYNSSEQFRADSFYIELFVKSGVIGIILFLLWLFQFILIKKPLIGISNSLPIGTSLIVSLLVYAMIDSGISSTGSLVHIFSWSMFNSTSTKLLD